MIFEPSSVASCRVRIHVATSSVNVFVLVLAVHTQHTHTTHAHTHTHSHTHTPHTHTQPPSDTYPIHVDSSGWRTVSHFQIGGNSDHAPSGSVDHAPLSSTMAASYLPVSQATQRVRAPSRDNLPLNYFPG